MLLFPATLSLSLLGSHDASTAVPVGPEHILIAEDESSVLKLYNKKLSGTALAEFPLASHLNLQGKEADLEASCISPADSSVVYWIGSMSNSRKGKLRPDRDRLFATRQSLKDSAIHVEFLSYYRGLRDPLIAWGTLSGLSLEQNAAPGIEPKRKDGFNLEGLEFGPDATTLYLAFRAPLVGAQHNRALIVPLLDFESWFSRSQNISPPRFGKAIELDLGGRGIRSLARNARSEYLIVAGSSDDRADFALYTWSGHPQDVPRLRKADLTGLAPEGIVDVPASLQGAFRVQLLSDFGKQRPSQLDWVDVAP